MDAERVRDDSWMENVVPCAPLPGAELWEAAVRKIRELGLERATIGVELGHSPRMIAGYLFASEYEYLKEQLPEAHVGISELEIAGIGELEMRRRGSEFHWPVTGSSEIASGYRSWYTVGGCTPPTDKLAQRGESLLVDMHPTTPLEFTVLDF